MALRQWLTNAAVVVVAVPVALVAMQLPALTDDYSSGLAQSAREVRGLIDQHELVVHSQYRIDAPDDAGLTEALRRVEPAHAEALSLDLVHWRGLVAATNRMESVGSLARPFAAMLDLADDPRGERRAVWRTALAHFTPRISFDLAALAYLLGGLLLGAVCVQAAAWLLRAVGRGRRQATA